MNTTLLLSGVPQYSLEVLDFLVPQYLGNVGSVKLAKVPWKRLLHFNAHV